MLGPAALRRDMPLRFTRRKALLAGLASLAARAELQSATPEVERWGIFEAAYRGPQNGNPFVDVTFAAQFRHEERTVDAEGFYDGDGTYRIRFMPDGEGEWAYVTRSNRDELDRKAGRFFCVPPAASNHGPVSVRNAWHFGYADGTRYFPFGTTCYAWVHQGDELEERTLATLRNGPFNKLRMCVFPKWYAFNREEPKLFPFERNALGENDYSRFNPQFFQHLERRVGELLEIGIQADMILFHPYDHWGYANMPAAADELYLRYVVARLSAYRNVWWSLANEWDLVKNKTLSDWDRFFRIVQESDPYQRLRSIHQSKVLYDHSKPWVSYASIQSDDFRKTQEWLDTYRKPVVLDECKYEGNIPQRWGNLSAFEMVRRFWLGAASGVYVGHGETYLDPHDILWWSKGGMLHGESAPRIAFLRHVVEEGPPDGLNPLPSAYYPCAAKPEEYYLYFFDYHQPAEYQFELPESARFHADLIDPWKMTITKIEGVHQGKALLKLPGSPYLAVRFRKTV